MDVLYMRAAELYKELFKEIGSFLKTKGFSRKGNCFYFRQGNNWGLLDFQKSRKSTAEEISFTINLGICSGKLQEFFSPDSLEQKPSIEACQWRERVGFLLPEHQDKWWLVRDVGPLASLVDELKGCLVRMVIPAIEQHLSDDLLCVEWSSGKSPGLTDIQRLMNLSVLLKVSGAANTLYDVMQELEVKSTGKPTASMVKQHLRRLEQVGSCNGT
jgi:hypothetical protein